MAPGSLRLRLSDFPTRLELNVQAAVSIHFEPRVTLGLWLFRSIDSERQRNPQRKNQNRPCAREFPHFAKSAKDGPPFIFNLSS